MKRLPTDLQILNEIYKRYYDSFASYVREDGSRSTKIYVPIDLQQISQNLKVDKDIIFGRLYYHFNKKYRYQQDDGSCVSFFALRCGEDIHCVNFPFMVSVLADLNDQASRYKTATRIAIGSLIVAVIAVLISMQ